MNDRSEIREQCMDGPATDGSRSADKTPALSYNMEKAVNALIRLSLEDYSLDEFLHKERRIRQNSSTFL
jgi:predicted phage-related endonuclease